MADETVRVFGVKEVTRAFRSIDGQMAKDFGNELKAAAEPVVSSAKSKIGRYQGASIRTIVARRSGPRVFVVQNARKVTGLRGDFGSLQMTHGLMPALEEKAPEVFQHVESILNRYAGEAGF